MLGGIGAGVAGAAPAATQTSCSKYSGSVKIAPPLGTNPQATTYTVKAKLGGCTGGGVTSGTVTGTLKAPNGSCTSGTPTGLFTIKWNTGATSTAKVKVAANPPALKTTGKVTAGLFKGDSVSGPAKITSTTGDCMTAPISAVKFKGTAKL